MRLTRRLLPKWIYEINVYDLKKRVWISRTPQPESQGSNSKGAYRSVAASSKRRVVVPARDGERGPSQSYSLEEEGEGGSM
jgi:hypothetical protein